MKIILIFSVNYKPNNHKKHKKNKKRKNRLNFGHGTNLHIEGNLKALGEWSLQISPILTKIGDFFETKIMLEDPQDLILQYRYVISHNRERSKDKDQETNYQLLYEETSIRTVDLQDLLMNTKQNNEEITLKMTDYWNQDRKKGIKDVELLSEDPNKKS